MLNNDTSFDSDVINLSTYNSSSNQFKAPCNGYLVLNFGYTNGSALKVVIENGYTFGTSSSSGYECRWLYIRKGTSLYIKVRSEYANVIFHKISN